MIKDGTGIQVGGGEKGCLNLTETRFEVIQVDRFWLRILAQVYNFKPEREYELSIYVTGERGDYNKTLGNILHDI